MTGSRRAIVIGAGPNGLAAAIRLAEAGQQVTVLEAAERPGGSVRTEELTLPGFHHDTFSAVYPAAAASPVFSEMPLERHGLRWVQPDACYAHPLPGDRAVILYRDLDRTAASLDLACLGDGNRWRAFISPLLDAFEAIRSTVLGPFPPFAGARKLIEALGLLGTARLGVVAAAPARILAARLFEGSASRAWLYGSAGHTDVAPTAPGSAIAAVHLNLMGHGVGWPSPAGGAQRLTDALVGYLQELGGQLHMGAAVEQIESAGARVSAVRVAGGERIPADVVIADVMPAEMLRLAGHALPRSYKMLLRRYRYGPATVKVDWALAAPIPWADPDVRAAGTVHLSGDESEILATMRETRRRLPQRPFLLLGQQSLADPSRAPEGRQTAWAYTHGPRQGIDWSVELERHVERIEAQVERFAPGFRDLILARHLLSPAELEHRNRNLVGGDVGGGSYRMQQVIFRPVPGISPYRTPLDGLYLASAATFPGGAVHGVAGDAAARIALAAGPPNRRVSAPR